MDSPTSRDSTFAVTVEAMFTKTRNERQQRTEEKEEVKEGAMLQDSQMNNTYFD